MRTKMGTLFDVEPYDLIKTETQELFLGLQLSLIIDGNEYF